MRRGRPLFGAVVVLTNIEGNAHVINLEDIRQARHRIAPFVRKTPLLAATALSHNPTPASLWLKLECLQVTGSFKARGATNKLLATPKEQLTAGVVTASGGNHGLAVAHAAGLAGVSATIFVPEITSPAKIERLRNSGARVEVTGAVWNETNPVALEFARQHNAAYFHPFADPAVMAGQGTLALEVLEQQPDLDVILIAIGGGGLIAGMSVALQALKPSIRIIGIEPTGCPTFHHSLAAGKAVSLETMTTRVATMACKTADPGVFEVARHAIEKIVLVEDDEMLDASRWLWGEMGLAADLSGAAACAALLSGRIEFEKGTNVCALVCGAGPEAITG
jgi:threonine dehydratase